VYFIVRVTSSQEKITADILQSKVAKTGLPVYSITVVEGMTGYIILEAENELVARELITNEPHVKGILPTPLSEEELSKMLEIKQNAQPINVNDIVEFVSGPFKGYKAKVKRIDAAKEEITVEPIDAPISIPVTAKMNTARVIQKSDLNK